MRRVGGQPIREIFREEQVPRSFGRRRREDGDKRYTNPKMNVTSSLFTLSGHKSVRTLSCMMCLSTEAWRVESLLPYLVAWAVELSKH